MAPPLQAWDWEALSENPALPWSAALIDAHADQWDWERLSTAPGLPWDTGLLAAHAQRWNWANLSGFAQLPWTKSLYRCFETHWFAGFVGAHQHFELPVLSPQQLDALLEKP